MSGRIAESEWLSELDRLMQSAGDDGLTVRELTAASGHSDRWVRDRLRAGIAAKRIIVGAAKRIDLAGRPQTCPVYRWEAD